MTMSKKPTTQAAISRLAALYPDDGELLASMNPVAFLDRCSAELARQRDQLTVMRAALEIANACGGLCVECVRRINAALARCTT
jgi:hypothetical protein